MATCIRICLLLVKPICARQSHILSFALHLPASCLCLKMLSLCLKMIRAQSQRVWILPLTSECQLHPLPFILSPPLISFHHLNPQKSWENIIKNDSWFLGNLLSPNRGKEDQDRLDVLITPDNLISKLQWLSYFNNWIELKQLQIGIGPLILGFLLCWELIKWKGN